MPHPGGSARPAAAGTSPKRLGSFEVLREIGQGGMGVVYLARQPALERLVVLKRARRELLSDASMLERFQREARAAAAVHHQNVVCVYDCFEARGDHYIAQELVDGKDLKSILARVGRIDATTAALVALEVARGLEEIHARGIVHRDVKPSNVLIGFTGETKIADFGIAVDGKADGLTRPGVLVGSIPYMAPEQLLGQRADYRTDVFLFGNLLYEMLAGAPPYAGPADEELPDLLARMQSESYAPLRRAAARAPRALARLVRGCLRSRPSKRIRSMTTVRRRLERALGRPSPNDGREEIARALWAQGVFDAADGKTEVRFANPRARGKPGRSRRRAAARFAAVVLLAVAGWAGWKVVAVGRAPAPATAAAPAPTTGSGSRAAATPPAPAPKPAQLHVVADPWASIRIDGGQAFLTPRAAPISLPPGRHRVSFVHPTLGTAEVVVDLKAGESRTVRHAFPMPEKR